MRYLQLLFLRTCSASGRSFNLRSMFAFLMRHLLLQAYLLLPPVVPRLLLFESRLIFATLQPSLSELVEASPRARYYHLLDLPESIALDSKESKARIQLHL